MNTPDYKQLRRFEDLLLKNSKATIEDNLKIVNQLHDQAVALGIFPLKDPLAGIEYDIKRSRLLNGLR